MDKKLLSEILKKAKVDNEEKSKKIIQEIEEINKGARLNAKKLEKETIRKEITKIGIGYIEKHKKKYMDSKKPDILAEKKRMKEEKEEENEREFVKSVLQKLSPTN